MNSKYPSQPSKYDDAIIVRGDVFHLQRGLTDCVRAISALMIAIGHYSGHASHYTDNIVFYFFSATGPYIGVAIFFFLSGYGLMMSEKKHHLSFRAFCKRRVLKVYYPVVFVSLIWGVAIWPEDTGIGYLPELIKISLFTFGDATMWFIHVLGILYAFFFAFTIIVARFNVLSELVYLIVGTIFLYYFIYVSWHDWCAIAIPLFTLGIATAKYNSVIYKIINSWWVFLWLLTITLLMTYLYFKYGNLYAHSLINYYTITALLLFGVFIKADVKIPSWMGDYSYDVYLTHYKVIMLLRPLNMLIGLHHFILGTVLLSTSTYVLRRELFSKLFCLLKKER